MMRAAIVSHTYVEDQNRGKLEALARKGVHVAAFVPSVWQEGALGKRWTVTHQSIGNLEIVPVPVRRTLETPAAALWDLGELKDRLARREIDLVQVEEEPWSLAALSALRAAHRHGVTSAIFTWQNLAGRPRWPFSILARKTLQLADGWIAGNEAGKTLLAQVSPAPAPAPWWSCRNSASACRMPSADRRTRREGSESRSSAGSSKKRELGISSKPWGL